MSCLFGKSLSIFSLSQMSFNYALTHDYRRNSNDYLCKITGQMHQNIKTLVQTLSPRCKWLSCQDGAVGRRVAVHSPADVLRSEFNTWKMFGDVDP